MPNVSVIELGETIHQGEDLLFNVLFVAHPAFMPRQG
jgi:hypothetical protein